MWSMSSEDMVEMTIGLIWQELQKLWADAVSLWVFLFQAVVRAGMF